MRTIKFRGMCANGVMRYGRLSQDKKDSTKYYNEYSQRICWDDSNIPVSNKSLGEYTGLKDTNGVEIYEGDLLQNTNPVWKKEIVSFVMEWDAAAARFSDYSPREDFEVIGNIYENPELIN